MTTIHKKDMILHEGDIHIVGYGPSIPHSYYYNTELKTCQQYRCDYGENKMLLYTTNKNLTTVTQLNRNHFMKPKEDVEELALNNMGYSTENFDNEDWVQVGYFISGHKANKAEFTMEEMFECFMAGLKSVDKVGRNEELFDKHIKYIRPLCIPEYIVIDNDEIVEVKW